MPPARKRRVAGNVEESSYLDLMASFEGDATLVTPDTVDTVVPTNYVIWDNVLGLRGIPFGGRVTQLMGEEHSGKSTLAYHLARAYQQSTDKPVILFDFEGTATIDYLRLAGMKVDRNHLGLFREHDLLECTRRCIRFMQAGVKFFIFDSVPRMKYMQAEKDIVAGDPYKATVGLHARAMQMFFDAVLPHAQRHDCALIMINQTRAKITTNPQEAFLMKFENIARPNITLPGGTAMKFTPALTIETKKGKALRAGDGDSDWAYEPATGSKKGERILNRSHLRILKNKVSMSGYRETDFYFRPGSGIDPNVSLRDLAVSYGLITRAGGKYVIGPEEDPIITYNTKDEAIADFVVASNPEVMAALAQILAQRIDESDASRFAAEVTPEEEFAVGARESLDGEDGTSTNVLTFDDDDED